MNRILCNNNLVTVSKSSQSLSTTANVIRINKRVFSKSSNDLNNDDDTLKQEKLVTVPNLLCLSRIAVAPYIAHLVINEHNFSLSLGLFCYAGLTDLLDGFIARRVPGQASSFGSFLDPLADKTLAAFLFLSLSYVGIVPMALTSLVVSRQGSSRSLLCA